MKLINSNTMRKYFEGFDYLKLKYSPLLKNLNTHIKTLLSKCSKMLQYGELDVEALFYKEFLNFERARHHCLYNDINYADIKKRIKLIYNSEKDADNFIFFYDFALDQLIDRFLNIESLDKLFSHHYFEFEWQQHMDLDFNKNDLSFYRDHFIHQIRNCYMLLTLLEDDDTIVKGNLLDKIISILKTRNTELSKYACVQIEQYNEHIQSVVNAILLKLNKSILSNNIIVVPKELASENNDVVTKKIIDEIKINDLIIEEITDKINKNAENYAWQYFVRGSLIIAALFHDIGYPIKFMHNRAKQLNDYVSIILPSDSIGFDKLNNLLETSLLFTVYDKEELASRYKECDHGALSAYILLLQFYETGAVHSLNSIKRAMIEFAALIIYDHTLKYKISNDKSPLRGKPSFIENPLSYMLRIIDDVQEWDRIYFEIRSNSDLRYCERCKMPISKIWNTDIEECFKEIEADKFRLLNTNKHGNLNYLPDAFMKRIYACGCSAEYKGSMKQGYYAVRENIKVAIEKRLQSYHFSTGIFENGSLFAYQKINYTITAKQIYFIKEENKNKCKIYIDYDAFMQLYLLTINCKALKYRIGELSKINDQCKLQSEVEFTIYAFLSDNPFMLKMRILCDFLYEVGHYIRKDSKYERNLIYEDAFKSDSKDFEFIHFYDIAKQLKDNNFSLYDYTDERYEEIIIDNKNNEIYEYLKIIITFLMRKDTKNRIFVNNLINICNQYLSLALTTPQNLNSEELETYYNKLCELKYIDETHKNACKLLIKDALEQLSYQKKDDLSAYYLKRKKESENDKIEYALSKILDKKYYDPRILRTVELNKEKWEFFDFYSDLYLFKEMYRFSIDNYERRTKNKG
ncbi:MAG: hypothetical protein HDR34_03535 [Treponema sp.]|nr:hypothetical protein [Treponema sp.]